MCIPRSTFAKVTVAAWLGLKDPGFQNDIHWLLSQSVSLLHSHIDKVVNMQTKYIELYLRVYVYVC